jgi:hypothetical protein
MNRARWIAAAPLVSYLLLVGVSFVGTLLWFRLAKGALGLREEFGWN